MNLCSILSKMQRVLLKSAQKQQSYIEE